MNTHETVLMAILRDNSNNAVKPARIVAAYRSYNSKKAKTFRLTAGEEFTKLIISLWAQSSSSQHQAIELQ